MVTEPSSAKALTLTCGPLAGPGLPRWAELAEQWEAGHGYPGVRRHDDIHRAYDGLRGDLHAVLAEGRVGQVDALWGET
jgi:hypothetical protein